MAWSSPGPDACSFLLFDCLRLLCFYSLMQQQQKNVSFPDPSLFLKPSCVFILLLCVTFVGCVCTPVTTKIQQRKREKQEGDESRWKREREREGQWKKKGNHCDKQDRGMGNTAPFLTANQGEGHTRARSTTLEQCTHHSIVHETCSANGEMS